ncbi:secretory calcium-binding phosphoprotein 9 isoform X3 [Sander lucioperca]|uniref:secretory calcium-binding phosphoprotein 9 isoform X3 n=1 Tax=Sander lucioperca TaxID=283035 RepID=UPI00125D18F0|nr:secretory calcium-binding phosphoprotein 9 isoform X3 [Sander lucioperca]
MKFLLLITFVATICYVNAGKKQRMIAAMNAMNTMNAMNAMNTMNTMNAMNAMNAMNGGMMAGMNGMNGGMMAGMTGMNGALMAGMANGVNPGRMAGGLNPVMAAGGGAGVNGPQFAQFVPRVPAFAALAPIPNVYAVPAVNGFPVPQMAQMNPPQQPLVGIIDGAVQQQLPLQPDPLMRFRRQVMKQDTLKTTVDTQIPAPTETTTTLCDKEEHHEDV